MGFRFSRRSSLFPGVRLNVGKTGVSTSVGTRGAWTTFGGLRLGVLRASVAGGRGVQHGTFEVRDGVPHVAAGAGWLRLDEVRPAGKRAMAGADWARGLRDPRQLGPEARLPS